MKKRPVVLGLAALTIGVSAAIMSRETTTPLAVPTAPITSSAPPSYAPPAHYRSFAPQTAQTRKSPFGLLSMIEPDLDATWTTEDRIDGKYLIDLQLRFKNRNGFGMTLANNLGQILHLQRRGRHDSYMIVGNNGNYFGAVNEKLEGVVTFDLYSGDMQPLWQRVRTFEFVPNGRKQ